MMILELKEKTQMNGTGAQPISIQTSQSHAKTRSKIRSTYGFVWNSQKYQVSSLVSINPLIFFTFLVETQITGKVARYK